MMDRATVNGIALEYRITGSGEPVLLIGPGPIADGFLPLESEPALAEGYCLVRYRQRGQVDGWSGVEPVSFIDHAADAAALLDELGMPDAHVIGHSTGAAIALELALLRPGTVRSLVLLEPPLTSASAAQDFFRRAAPALAAYGAGDKARAIEEFLALVSGLQWQRCRSVTEAAVPGGVERAIAQADLFFGSYIPALEEWRFGEERAERIEGPVMSIVGGRTDRFFAESHELLRLWIPGLETATISDAGHLLHLEQPSKAARVIARFLGQRIRRTDPRPA